MAKIESKLLKLGFQIIAISSDQPEKLKESILKLKLNYRLLSDHEMKAAKAFGLAFKVNPETFSKLKGFGIDLEKTTGKKHHLLPVPGVFLVDTNQVIQFQYVNPDYKIRLNPDILLVAARSF